MKKTVWTFGLISGGILSLVMAVTTMFTDQIGVDHGEIIGYTTMVLAFLLIYFGVRSYRDEVLGGTITFGRAFAVGSLIAIIASLCYVATWEVVYYKVTPDFMTKYQAHMVAKAKANGVSQEVIDQKIKDGQRFAEMYNNPLINSALTMLEPLPVWIVVALVSAGVLRRKRVSRSIPSVPTAEIPL